jgi:hypothetical protein
LATSPLCHKCFFLGHREQNCNNKEVIKCGKCLKVGHHIDKCRTTQAEIEWFEWCVLNQRERYRENSMVSVYWAKWLTYTHSTKRHWKNEFDKIPVKHQRLKGAQGKA